MYEQRVADILRRGPLEIDKLLLSVPLICIHKLLHHHYFIINCISPAFASLPNDTWVALKLGIRNVYEYIPDAKLQEGSAIKLIDMGLHCHSIRHEHPTVFGVLRKPYRREPRYLFFSVFVHLTYCDQGITSVATRMIRLAVPKTLTLGPMKNPMDVSFEKMLGQRTTFKDGELKTLPPLRPWEQNKGWQYPGPEWWNKYEKEAKGMAAAIKE